MDSSLIDSDARLSSCAGHRHDQLSPDFDAPPKWQAMDSAADCIPVPLLFFYPAHQGASTDFGTGKSIETSLARQGHRCWHSDYRITLHISHHRGQANPDNSLTVMSIPRSLPEAIKCCHHFCGMRPPVPPNDAGVHQRDTADGLTPTNRATVRQPPRRATTVVAGFASCLVFPITFLKKISTGANSIQLLYQSTSCCRQS